MPTSPGGRSGVGRPPSNLHPEFNPGPQSVLGGQGRSPHRLRSVSCSQYQLLLTGTLVPSVIFVTAACWQVLGGWRTQEAMGVGRAGGKGEKPRRGVIQAQPRLTRVSRGLLEAKLGL